jgi:hypothetical protein
MLFPRRRSDSSPKPRGPLLLQNHLEVITAPATTDYLFPQALFIMLDLTSTLAENKERQLLGVLLSELLKMVFVYVLCVCVCVYVEVYPVHD